MVKAQRLLAVLVCCCTLSPLGLPARAQQLRGDLSLFSQVRDGDQSRETEAPVDVYGDLGVAGLPHDAGIDVFFRLNREFGRDEGAADLYAGSLHARHVLPGLDVTLGRQFLSEVPGGAFVADAGKLRLDVGGPVSLTVFGGQPQYFEPTISSELLSQDEVLWGGNIGTTRWQHGRLSVGYLQQERDQRVLRQLITAAGKWSLPALPGVPGFYGSAAYDADHQNLDFATAGANLSLGSPRLLVNIESTYYKPQDQGERLTTDINRREDAIFEVFSLSGMLQFRGALRYALSRTVSAYGNYSYQRYEQVPGDFENGHVASGGLLWLPGGDGLELVRLEYYLVDSGGGNVNGGKAAYESRVYEQLTFRTKLDIASIDKVTNQSDVAVSGLVGLGYVFYPGLFCELDFEANHNKRFDEDFRFGFLVSYNFGYSISHSAPGRRRRTS